MMEEEQRPTQTPLTLALTEEQAGILNAALAHYWRYLKHNPDQELQATISQVEDLQRHLVEQARAQALQPQRIHQVVVDGQVIYEGDDWQQVFFDAARNPNNGTVVHAIDGKTTLIMGPMVRLIGTVCPFVPPVQSVDMQHPAFIRGYNNGLATSELSAERIADEELVNLLRSIFEQAEQGVATEEDVSSDVYYGVGNLMGVLDAQHSTSRTMPMRGCLCSHGERASVQRA